MQNNEVIDCLNDLLTKAYDAEEGFKKATEHAEGHPGLVGFFTRQSKLRLAFGHEIKEAVARYGGEPDKGSSATAKAHQIWITIREKLGKEHNEESMLEEECIRGEEAALKEYDKKLNQSDLPADVRDLITQQRGKIADSLLDVKTKEKSAD